MTADPQPPESARRGPRLDLRSLLDLEPPTARRNLTILLLMAAVLSPNIGLPAGLPAVRLEQMILALALPSLARYHLRHPEARRIGWLDWAFLLIVVAFGTSVTLAPVVVPVLGRSYHDLFDALRPIEYWLLYRTGRLVPIADIRAREVALLAAAAGIGSGVLAFVQRFGPQGFNDAVTAIWTGPGHNLDGVIVGGRPVGTLTNANSFGLFCALIALLLLTTVALRHAPPGRLGGAVWLGLALGVAGLVLSQSRSASLAVAGAIALGLIVLFVSRSRPSLLRPAVVVVPVVLATAGLLAVTPPAHSSSIVQRFSPDAIGGDTSLVIRLARLRLAFARPDTTLEQHLACETGSPGSIRPGHEPGPVEAAAAGDSADPAAGATAAVQRDEQRIRDVTDIATRVQQVFCLTGHWPTEGLAALYAGSTPPLDPQTGRPYDTVLTATGYSVSATLETPSGPQSPMYTLSSSPDLVTNPSFEQGLSDWEPSASTQATVVPGGRFGQHAVRIAPTAGAEIHQYVMYAFPARSVYAAQVWARATDGTAASVALVVNAWLTNGDRITPLAQTAATLPADGRWMPINARIQLPPTGQVWVLQLALTHGDVGGAVAFDGAIVAAGPTAPSFSAVQEVDPTRLPSSMPSFWESPILGLGSLTNFELGAFDNEYAYVVVHFGLLGLLGYLVLFAVVLVQLARAWWLRRSSGLGAAAFGMALFTLAMLAFNVTAGVFFSYQLMAIYWPLVGIVGTVAGPLRDRSMPPVPGSGSGV